MPYADPERQREAMRQWRLEHPGYHADYSATHPLTQTTLDKKRVRSQQRYRDENGPIEFVGVDGEGMGEGYAHRYYTLRSGDNLLSGTTAQHLPSWDCLNFIANQSIGPKYVIYSGNYDFTHWLREMPEVLIRELLNRNSRANGNNVTPVRWDGLRIDYLPHKRLSVRRKDAPPIVVHDVFGFFQCSFVVAISDKPVNGFGGWNIGTPEERALILEGKNRRGNTDVLSPKDIEYNRIECKLLSELMHKFNETVSQVMLSASPYEGAGALASSLLNMYVGKPVKERNRVAKRAGRPTEPIAPPDFDDQYPTWDAYYGGRFEITAHGPVAVPVYEYDINSAYPAAIRSLPCLRHGHWSDNPSDVGTARSVTLGHLRWRCGDGANLGPLPHRNRTGNVTFPLMGSGWYWSVEWPTNRDEYQIDESYTWIPSCNCTPYEWIAQVYEARKAHKKAGRVGAATSLKLAYNSCYGKLAQQVGKGPWRNSVYAGLVTAQTRRWMRDAAMQAPNDIVMLATDGIYSLVPLDLPLGDGLGEWEEKVYEDGLHFVRPGIYFTADGTTKIKSRGISRRVIEERAQDIISTFDLVHDHPEWIEPPYGDDTDWRIPLPAVGMISLKLAFSQNNPDKAGYVGMLKHSLSYSMRPKRIPRGFENGILRSDPPLVPVRLESYGHGKSGSAVDPDTVDALASAPENVSTQLSLF